MSFLQQAFSPFIGRRSKKKRNSGVKEKFEAPPTYPYYPDPVVRYRRENSPFTAVFPQEPVHDNSSCSSHSSSVRGWQTPNGFVPSRPLSPTFSKESINHSTLSSQSSIQYRDKHNDSSITPLPYTPSPASIFQAESEVTLTRSPSPPFPCLNSNATTPCVTPSPSLAPLSKIPNRKMVSRSPERCSTELGNYGDRRSTSRPPPGPSTSMRSIGVQTPVMERRIILPGGATPVLGRRGVVGVVKSGPNCRDSAYSQCSFQTCSEYKPKDSTSLFRALSLTPKVRRKKNRDDELSFGRCSTATLTESGRETPSAVSEVSTLKDMPILPISNNFETASACGRSSVIGNNTYNGRKSSGVSLVSNGKIENNNLNDNCVVEVRVGEAGLVRRRQKSYVTGPHEINTSVRVSVHKETWHCLPLVSKDVRVPGCKRDDLELRPMRASIIPEDVRLTSTVTLHKKDNVTLGIVVAGGSDKGYRPRVARLRPGSAAHRCDKLAVGDYILAVNGCPTEDLSHQEIVALLRNAGNRVSIDIEYETPSLPGIGPEGAVVRRTTVGLMKEGGSLGITVRGGVHPSQPDKTRPLLITHVRTAGPVDREGTIKAGDRLVAVGGRSVERSTMLEAQDLLKSAPDALSLTIEYDVSVLSSVRGRGAALLVEVERPAATDLGLSLDRGQEDTIVVRAVQAASIAERCGALAVGDVITRIDGTPVGQLTPTEATQLLRSSRHPVVTLEIIPVSAAASSQGPPHPHIMGSSCTGGHRNQHSSIPFSPAVTPPGTAPQIPFSHPSLHSPASYSNMPPTYSSTSGSHCPTYSTPYFSNFCTPSTPCYSASPCSPSSCRHHATACPSAKCSDLVPFHNHNGVSSVNGGAWVPTSGARCGGRDAGSGCAQTSRLGPHANDPYAGLDCLPQDAVTTDDNKVCRLCSTLCSPDLNTQACGCSGGMCDNSITSNKFSVTLAESDKGGYGLVLRPPLLTTDPDLAVPVVAGIDPHSPADRCGVLCVGDRISSVNGLSTTGLGAAEVIQLIATSQQSVALAIEFDTDECYRDVAATDTLAVTLPVKNAPLGIGVTLSESPLTRCGASGDPADDRLGLLITSVMPGSPAHRSSLVAPGDLLVAVDDHHVMDSTSAQDILGRVAQSAGRTVTLLVHKADDGEECVQYTVEVTRRGGPLGITLTGSELPCAALYVASLAPGGLAERTGAIHAGDRLLAINGCSLRGQPLSRAVHLLQAAAQVVTLRIARPRRPSGHLAVSDDWVTNPPSVDSAVESWGGSSGGDLGDHQAASPPVSPSPPTKRTEASNELDSPRTRKELEKISPTQNGGAEPSPSPAQPERHHAAASYGKGSGRPAILCEKTSASEKGSAADRSTASDLGSKGSPVSDLRSSYAAASDSGSKGTATSGPEPRGAAASNSGSKGTATSDLGPRGADEQNNGEGSDAPNLASEALEGDSTPERCEGIHEGLSMPKEGDNSGIKDHSTANESRGDITEVPCNAVKDRCNAAKDLGYRNRNNTIERRDNRSNIIENREDIFGNTEKLHATHTQGGKASNSKLKNEEGIVGGAALKNCRNATSDFGLGNETDTAKHLPPDWDEMIAALNEISASCGMNARQHQLQSLHQHQHDTGGQPMEGHPLLSHATGHLSGELDSPAIGAGGRTETGVYSVSAAERNFGATTHSSERSDTATHRMFRVSLCKDPVYEDFGFSVSDGLYEKGVYVNRIRKGGPADRSGRVNPYDRILQVNDTLSHDFDCCLTVPLIASAGDQLHLLLSRNLNEEMTPLLRRTPDFGVNPFTECHSQPKQHQQQYFSQDSSDFGVYAPLNASAKLQADRSEFLNAQLYCNSSPYLRKAEIHTRSVPRVAETSSPHGQKGSPKSTNLSMKPPSPTVSYTAERNQKDVRDVASSNVHQKISLTSSSISELEDQLKCLSNLNRPHLQQWADETLTLPAHFRSSSGPLQQTRPGSKAPLTPQLGRQCLGNDSGCRTNGSPVGDKVQAFYASAPDSNAPALVAANSTTAVTPCTAVPSGSQNGRSSFALASAASSGSLSPVSVNSTSTLRAAGNGPLSSSLSPAQTSHLHNTESPSSLYVSKATVQFQVPASPKEKSRRSGANSSKALYNLDNSTAVLKTS